MTALWPVLVTPDVVPVLVVVLVVPVPVLVLVLVLVELLAVSPPPGLQAVAVPTVSAPAASTMAVRLMSMPAMLRRRPERTLTPG